MRKLGGGGGGALVLGAVVAALVGCGRDKPKVCADQQSSTPCCGTFDDCNDGSQLCLAPGADLGCGICFDEPGDCVSDSECPTGDICELRYCACAEQRTCVAGCATDANCASGEQCNTETYRCERAACDDATDCPVDFACEPSGCVRASCLDDDDCDGFCVKSTPGNPEGQCYATAGECVSLPQ